MAATLVTTIKKFSGTAAEMAALDVTGLSVGSTFFTTDEGYIYALNAAGTWDLKKVSVGASALPAGAATAAKQDTAQARLNLLATEAKQDTLNAKDFATQTTLEAARVLLNSLDGKDYATQTTLAAILAKIIAAPATEAKQDTLIAKDFATQTTLAAILAKIIASPATEAKQDTAQTRLNLLATEAKQDTLIAKDFATAAKQDAAKTVLDTISAKDFATQATLAAVATAAKQDTAQTRLDLLSTEATLAAILAKIIAAPSTEAKQDTQITRLNLLSTEATLEAVRAALVAGGLPATTLETTHQNAATTDGNGTAATVSGYGPMAFQATGTFDTATVTYQGSVDGTNYVALPGSSAVTTAGIFQIDVSGYKSVRAVISGAGASTNLTVKSLAVAVAKPTAADVTAVGKAADDAAATGNPVLLAGRFDTTPATRQSGDAVTLQTNATGALRTELTGSNVESVLTTGLLITAGANVEVAKSSFKKRYSIGVRENFGVAHDFLVLLGWGNSADAAFHTGGATLDTVATATNRIRIISGQADAKSIRGSVYITNSSAGDKTYSVYKYDYV